MKIPKGFRLASDEEVMQNGWRKGRKGSDVSLAISSGWVGKTLKVLKEVGAASPSRVVFAPLATSGWPHFDGWYPIGMDVPWRKGDSAVLIKDSLYEGHNPNEYKTPETGFKEVGVGGIFSRLYDMDKNVVAGNWCVYRPIREQRISRLPPNPEQLTRPLPLP